MSRDIIEDFFESLERTLEDIKPVGKALQAKDEELLIRYCFVLALYEQCYRAGLWPNSLLFTLGNKPTVEDLLNLPRPDWIVDIGFLMIKAITFFEHYSYKEAIVNPSFTGSMMTVGGADADLILDGCLIDIKSTSKAKISNTDLYQIIGYALLDSLDTFEIHSLGLYMARQGELIKWTIPELLDRVMDGHPEPLDQLREELQVIAMHNIREANSHFSEIDHIEGTDEMTDEEIDKLLDELIMSELKYRR